MSLPTSVNSNLTPAANASDVERTQFVIRAALAGLRTAMPVKVLEVTNNGGVSPIGFVNVQPLVSGEDGMGNAWPHGTIYNVPYMRIQGGSNAVIIDPQVDDIGIATVCDRDISTVKNSEGVSAPGSLRRHDMSDMIYLMTIIAAAPTQYIQFNSSGISIVSPNAVNVQAETASVTTTGNVSVTAGGSATVQAASAVLQAASIKLQNSGTALLNLLNSLFSAWAQNHVHSNGNGGANTGTPTTAPPANGQTSVVQAE
jgi:hypothetical protein